MDFQDSGHGGHLGFLIRPTLAIFDLQVALMFSTKQPWWSFWISNRNNFSYFLSTSHPDASYQVSRQSAFRYRRSENIFFLDSGDGDHGGHLGFPISTVLAIFFFFFICLSPRCFLQSFKSISLLFQEKKRKIDFQDGCPGCHLGFLIRKILATLDLQVTLMLPIKFQVNWPFVSGEEAKNRFLRWRAILDFWSD